MSTPTKAQIVAENIQLKTKLASARAALDELTGIAALKAEISSLRDAGARIANLETQLMQLTGINLRLQTENNKLRGVTAQP